MDALSEILRVLQLNSGIFLESEFTAPWCIDSAPRKSAGPALLPEAEHIATYHLLTRGSCFARLIGSEDIVELKAGDLILFPNSDGHLLGSDLQRAPIEYEVLVQHATDGGIARIRHGGGGARTDFVCGYLACNARLCKPLLGALPRMLRIPLGDSPAGHWITSTLQQGAAETHAPRPGSAAVLRRLAELVFVEAMRLYIQSLPANQASWLAGLRDPAIGRALALLHAEPERDWKVDTLANAVGMSRSTLNERFAAFVGEAPMHYLTGWRMALAAQMLATNKESVLRIAERCGYQSEAAFNRAFKREHGAPPAAWRNQRWQGARPAR